MFSDLKINSVRKRVSGQHEVKIVLTLILTFILAACSTNLQTKVAGNLNQLSNSQTVAILPVEIMEKDQKETAAMFRQALYANLKQSKFNLLERYVVDSLLKQRNLTNPAQFIKMNPMEFAEILGVDAVLITRINKVERSYMVVHSSIEIGISAQMVDTRTGEILWRAEQTESDFQGIGKIPTGISAAVLGPLQFVTNKLNLHRMTSNLVNKLTAIVKNPEDAKKEETFDEPLIASRTKRDLKKIEGVHDLEAKWAEDVATYTEPLNLKDKKDKKESLPVRSPLNFQADTEQPQITKPFTGPEDRQPSRINWTPRSTAPKPHASLQYTIQVGAYKTKGNASQMASSLSDKGYKTRVTLHLDGGSTIFKVHVEKFNNKEQANELANKLADKENLSTFITTIDPS